jgi:catechol 2,3-dioxygenase-like lactoylglutathione lyase family enzyme
MATGETKMNLDMRLELINVPVSDVERSIDFYVNQVGFILDHDHTPTDQIRFVQLTPPGSPSSISIGRNLGSAQPGSARGLQLVVDDIEAARAGLAARGVEMSEIDEQPWGRFAYFSDPDGNGWVLQLNSRLSG